jgi:hypothetical protein
VIQYDGLVRPLAWSIDMQKHMYIYYGDDLGLGEISRSIIVGTKLVTAEIADACRESFKTENGTYHYQAEYRKEVFAYLAGEGVKVPIAN